MEPDPFKLAADIEASRIEIEKLQERVRQLVARRGKRAELVKSNFPKSELAPENLKTAGQSEGLGQEMSVEEGLRALKNTKMSEVRLIAFKHGAVVFLFDNERTLAVRMDDRGPKPLLDLLSANESGTFRVQAPPSQSGNPRTGL